MVSSSVLPLLLLSQLIELKAQTGVGCFSATCTQPNLVRIDARFNSRGVFIGGCNCACNPDLYISTSSIYCAPPKEINFDPNRLIGDCSCKCPPSASPQSCTPPSIWDSSTCECRQIVCIGNQIFDTQIGDCICSKVAPICAPPLTQDPITCDCVIAPIIPLNPLNPPIISVKPVLPPPPLLTVSCGIISSCSCPAGSDCTINCKGHPDSCKDAVIDCKNEGYHCIVNCMADNACSAASIINGPVGGSLTVNCLGPNACSGAPVFNGQDGADLAVVCEGSLSCKGNDIEFNFGTGIGTVECNGIPDSCQGVEIFNLPTNIKNILGAGFQCIGINCPVTAPEPFLNEPTAAPTFNPSVSPTKSTNNPTPSPTESTNNPTESTAAPTFNPTTSPSKQPSGSPTFSTNNPSQSPSTDPSQSPTFSTNNPSQSPSTEPSESPTFSTNNPSPAPTDNPTPTPTDIPTINPTVAPTEPTYSPTRQTVFCTTPGSCYCPPGIGSCDIYCGSSMEACKDGIIECAGSGYDCTVFCVSDSSCSGTTSIIAPYGGSLTVRCIGNKSCGGNVHFNAKLATDLTVFCEGAESCKGNNVEFNFGTGVGTVVCSDALDSCQGAVFNQNTKQISMQCIGSQCPSSI